MCGSHKNKLAVYNLWLTCTCTSVLLCEKGKDNSTALISFHEWWDSSFLGALSFPGQHADRATSVMTSIHGWSVEVGQHSQNLGPVFDGKLKFKANVAQLGLLGTFLLLLCVKCAGFPRHLLLSVFPPGFIPWPFRTQETATEHWRHYLKKINGRPLRPRPSVADQQITKTSTQITHDRTCIWFAAIRVMFIRLVGM